jgi:hypothetical protein
MPSIEIARSQGALAWEFRLGSTLVTFDHSDSATERLREIVNRISEGCCTRDYRDAVAKLEGIGVRYLRPQSTGKCDRSMK